MCGRYSFVSLIEAVEAHYGIHIQDSTYRARYNCAPSQNLAVIRGEGQSGLAYLKWGLVPFWSKDPAIGNKMINAKAETIHEKPSFKHAFRKRRCLVPATSFFEWKNSGNREKRPFLFRLKNRELFSMAGIWEKWNSIEGLTIESFAIITTDANGLMKDIHHRMPVILDRNHEDAWLNSQNPEELHSLLKPFNSDKMEAYEVSKLVNMPVNDTAEILKPVAG